MKKPKKKTIFNKFLNFFFTFFQSQKKKLKQLTYNIFTTVKYPKNLYTLKSFTTVYVLYIYDKKTIKKSKYVN